MYRIRGSMLPVAVRTPGAKIKRFPRCLLHHHDQVTVDLGAWALWIMRLWGSWGFMIKDLGSSQGQGSRGLGA